jgi:predicted RNase H-like nuclease (RuvC/YqgF family)
MENTKTDLQYANSSRLKWLQEKEVMEAELAQCNNKLKRYEEQIKGLKGQLEAKDREISRMKDGEKIKDI